MSRTASARSGHKRTAGSLTIALAALFVLAACASSPTPYQAAASGEFGYREQQIEEDRYRVTFAGNSATSRQTVEDFLLYRAAELTVQTGHDYFEVVDRSTDQAFGGSVAAPQVGVGYGSGSGFGVGFSLPVLGGTGNSSSYTAQMDILLHDGQKPQGDPDAYDAWEVISRLQPKVLTGGT